MLTHGADRRRACVPPPSHPPGRRRPAQWVYHPVPTFLCKVALTGSGGPAYSSRTPHGGRTRRFAWKCRYRVCWIHCAAAVAPPSPPLPPPPVGWAAWAACPPRGGRRVAPTCWGRRPRGGGRCARPDGEADSQAGEYCQGGRPLAGENPTRPGCFLVERWRQRRRPRQIRRRRAAAAPVAADQRGEQMEMTVANTCLTLRRAALT